MSQSHKATSNKKPSGKIPVLEQVRARGQYESVTTDTAQLARELAAPQDLGQLTADFDNGLTPLRDVGNMFTAQRTAILNAYEAGTIDNMATTHAEILSMPVQNLHERVVSGARDQPIGHNFFANATGFLNAQLPWAIRFNELLQIRTGASLRDITNSDDMLGKDQLLTAITENPDSELMTTLAVYLAGRSLEGERYLQQHYGEVLERAKDQVFQTTQRIGATTGLRIDMLERAAGQLQRATFGSFDHLQGLVTSDNSGRMGDYRIGSLRIEIQFDGSIHSVRLRDGSGAYHVAVHELQHAGSAQTQEHYRCGLQINGWGLEGNEGMTEYLTQIAMGKPGIIQSPNGNLYVKEDVPYRAPVTAILALHEQFKMGKNNHFAVLFNAYHGDVRSSAHLEQALDAFYRHDIAVSTQLGR